MVASGKAVRAIRKRHGGLDQGCDFPPGTPPPFPHALLSWRHAASDFPTLARQLEANRRHWQTRLAAIETELATEPERIRALYRIKARRVDPIGLVYLWPVTG